MTFSALQLAEPVLRAVTQAKYTEPSPIQKQAIPHLLEGKDMFGCAQTGTGKTAAFALPIIHALHTRPDSRRGRAPRALVLAPTRELAAQVAASFAEFSKFTGIRTTMVCGGLSLRPQANALRNGVDVLVATPGRLMDLIRQRMCDLRSIQTVVLDEADHMLDLGFIHDVKSILAKTPRERQTLLFSATMPKEIAALADSVLREPVNVAVAPVSSTVETVSQTLYYVEQADKTSLLVELLNKGMETSLVFSRTKHGADKICRRLNDLGIAAQAIHSNKSQSARKDALASFKKGKVRVLVATDIAARGIDISSLGHVVNYDLPDVPETYVHRIGRTGRAGRSGAAVSFCDKSEQSNLRAIERLIKGPIPIVRDHTFAGRHVERSYSHSAQPTRDQSARRGRDQRQGQDRRARSTESAGEYGSKPASRGRTGTHAGAASHPLNRQGPGGSRRNGAFPARRRDRSTAQFRSKAS